MIKLKVEKIADRDYIFMGVSNRVKYSVIITNIGNTIARCIKVKDVSSEGAFFVKGSFSVNGCNHDICDIGKFFSIGALKPGSNIVISYEIEIIRCNPPASVVNKAIVTYCDENNIILEVASNKLDLPIINVAANICKTVDKDIAKVGEIISYSLLVTNNGNIDIKDVVLYDELSGEVELLPMSVLINTEKIYPETLNKGINLGTIGAHSSKVVSFQVVIRCMPDSMIIMNTARIEFVYTVSNGEILVNSVGETCSNKVSTKVLKVITNC